MITPILASLIVLFNSGIAAAPTPYTSYTTASRANGASFLKLNYGSDAIMATTSADGKYTITLCNANDCHLDTPKNLDNVAFVTAAEAIGCKFNDFGYANCPTNVVTAPGTVYEDGSVSK